MFHIVAPPQSGMTRGSSLLGRGVKLGDDVVQHAEEGRNGFGRHAVAKDGMAHGSGDIGQFFLEGLSLGRELHDDLAGILFALRARDEPFGLHPFQERGHGIGLKQETLGYIVYRLSILLPQHQEHQVLGIRQSLRPQHGVIDLRNQARRRIEPETELVFQFETSVHYSMP